MKKCNGYIYAQLLKGTWKRTIYYMHDDNNAIMQSKQNFPNEMNEQNGRKKEREKWEDFGWPHLYLQQ